MNSRKLLFTAFLATIIAVAALIGGLFFSKLAIEPKSADAKFAESGETGPSPPIEVGITFSDVAEPAGIRFKHYNSSRKVSNILQTTGSGCGFCDYDDDGYLDVYLVNNCDLYALWKGKNDGRYRSALYRNNKDGTFTDVTSLAGVGAIGFGMGCTFGDYDNDGDQDLYVTNYGKNALYRNNGDGAFTDVTDSAGVGDARSSTACMFADFDSDGDLDLFVVNFIEFGPDSKEFCSYNGVLSSCPPSHYDGQPDRLFRNNGDGTFTDVTTEAGLPQEICRGLAVACGDYDNDGDMDIYVGNDVNENFLYRNESSVAKIAFKDVALFAGVAFDETGMPDNAMGIGFEDYDNDGYLDIFIANYQNSPNLLFHNEDGSLFAGVTTPAGIGVPTLNYLAFGTQFFDYNNDGYLDAFAANGHVLDNIDVIQGAGNVTYKQTDQLFKNNRDGTFTEVSDSSGSGFRIVRASRGAAFGDYDNDGDVDILVNNSNDCATLLRNDGGNRNAFLMLKTIGIKSNRNGFGARVRVICDSLSQTREVKDGGSFCSHSDSRLLIGLEQRRSAEYLEIKWPSGVVENFENVPVGRLITLREGCGMGVR